MSKKYTIRDIARQAGVSVATVSYVINNRNDQRISEETKKKVWQIVNLLDYRPNSSAKSLAAGKTYRIALYMTPETCLYKRSEQLATAEMLADVLGAHGYHLLLQRADDIAQTDYADAILCYDADRAFFTRIGDNNLIPLLAVDMLTPEQTQIFYQICTDYAGAKKAADDRFGTDNYTYLCLQPNNEELKALILETFPAVVFVSGTAPALPSGNIVYQQDCLSGIAGENAYRIPCDRRRKMEQVFSCFELAVCRADGCAHRFFI